MQQVMTRELIARLPKTDLHVHLDGSVRIPTLIELARAGGVTLPSYTEAGLRETVFKARYTDLPDYLRGFQYCTSVMQTREQLERIAYELAEDNQAEGVRYIEVRFAPQLHAHPGLNMIDAVHAVDKGLKRATVEFNTRPEIVSGSEPPFKYGIIVCAMRYFEASFSEYYRSFLDLHNYFRGEEAYTLASLDLVRAAAHARHEEGLPVVGVDLAGPEKGYPPQAHREAYQYAHRMFLNTTVHAGEDYGPESIFQAITYLHADRIGHGTHLLNPESIRDPAIVDREQYVEKLARFIANRRITLEVCLTSNSQTHETYRDLAQHPFGMMMEHKLSVTLCTDNRTVSRTTVTDEIYKAVTTFGLTLKDVKNILVYGFKRSFYPGEYTEKRAYVRANMDFFDRLTPHSR